MCVFLYLYCLWIWIWIWIHGVTSHLASEASLKNPSETECLSADSESLIWFSQYEEEDKRLNFIRLDVLEISEAGVWLLLWDPWTLPDLIVLLSEIGVMLPTNFRFGVGDAFTGLESLLGGLALVDLSLLPEKSRPHTLLLRRGVLNPLKMKVRGF